MTTATTKTLQTSTTYIRHTIMTSNIDVIVVPASEATREVPELELKMIDPSSTTFPIPPPDSPSDRATRRSIGNLLRPNEDENKAACTTSVPSEEIHGNINQHHPEVLPRITSPLCSFESPLISVPSSQSSDRADDAGTSQSAANLVQCAAADPSDSSAMSDIQVEMEEDMNCPSNHESPDLTKLSAAYIYEATLAKLNALDLHALDFRIGRLLVALEDMVHDRRMYAVQKGEIVRRMEELMAQIALLGSPEQTSAASRSEEEEDGVPLPTRETRDDIPLVPHDLDQDSTARATEPCRAGWDALSEANEAVDCIMREVYGVAFGEPPSFLPSSLNRPFPNPSEPSGWSSDWMPMRGSIEQWLRLRAGSEKVGDELPLPGNSSSGRYFDRFEDDDGDGFPMIAIPFSTNINCEMAGPSAFEVQERGREWCQAMNALSTL